MSHSDSKFGDSAEKLTALRAEIDVVDKSLHDLLMRRAALTLDMGALKARQADAADHAGKVGPLHPIRPAREAIILRKLAARHSGAPCFAVVAQVWRELIAANLREQCPFEIAVLETGDGRLWDAAHTGYGASTRVTAYFRARDVMEAVSAAPRGVLGILPAPAGATPEHRLWPELLAVAHAPRIVCALPHLASEPWPKAFAVAHALNEPSGDDVSLVLLTGETPLSPETDEVARAGLGGRIDAFWPSLSHPGLHCALAAVRGFLTAADPALARLDEFRRQAGGAATLIGAVPAPVRPPDE